MSRADDDKIFGFGSENFVVTSHDEKIIVRENNVLRGQLILKVEDTLDSVTFSWFTLDEAEALAYRLLYAVNRIKEDADD